MDVSWIRAVGRVLLGVVWFVCVPAIFAFFYTVIETQSAARVAVGANSRLAPFTISRLADRLSVLEDEIATTSKTLTALDEEIRLATVKLAEAKQKSTVAITSVWITLRKSQPTCELEQCLNDIITDSEQQAWNEGDAIPKRVALAQQLYETYLTAQFRKADLDDRNRHAEIALAAAKAEYHGGKSIEATVQPPDAASTDASAGDQPDDGAPVDTETGSTEDQKAVALSFNRQRAIPLFEFAFFLPSGVIVASFTGLMGAIGAAVYSLYVELGMVAGPKGLDRTWMAFGVRPLLGALAGFTVFFVISAGASFLIQPQAIEATQAVNQLSPPALASLGLFAGLASENALQWLIEKANSFFKSSGDGDGAAETQA
jgi:hypothetical protein